MQTFESAQKILSEYSARDRNEADTRHQIIDRVIHDVLAWPRDRVRVENYANDGYADYLLLDTEDSPILIVEAKKEGADFDLPQKIRSDAKKIHRCKLRVLISVPEIKAAVQQVAGYCLQLGSEYAAISNGHALIVFKAFTKGRQFLDGRAIVIPSLDCLVDSYVDVEKVLSYAALFKDRSLATELAEQSDKERDLFYPKNAIPHYDSPLAKNELARYLEPLARRYFQDISPNDVRLMKNCYVYSSGSPIVEEEIRNEIRDHITPFFEQDGGKEVERTRSGGFLTARIAESIAQKQSDVVILYGGKGAGKSTFLKRIFYFEQPPEFRMYAFPILVDYLRAPQDKQGLKDFAWETLVKALDQDQILEGSLEGLEKLFGDRITIAERQQLSVFEGRDREVEKAKLLCAWKGDIPYVVSRLVEYWNERQKSVVIAFDNTDQLAPALQDHCFLVAQNIAQELGCIALISMREERYCRARTNGVLDAYHNAGFHLSSPDLGMVFEKRIKFLLSELWVEQKKGVANMLPSEAPREDVFKFYAQCLKQFKTERNALSDFLSQCAHDNVRQALQFFRQFTTSGYTHTDDLVRNKRWTVATHQVIKPMMIPERYNYNESKSLIPNIFQCRNTRRGSHFTGLRLLELLKFEMKTTPDKAGYRDVVGLCDHFESRFGMREDAEICIDIYLQHGLIEANNRLDEYSAEYEDQAGNRQVIFADRVRITSFGIYMMEFITKTFAYLDLVSLDTGISDESVYNSFCERSRTERDWALSGDRASKLQSRIERTSDFVAYLLKEEEREVGIYPFLKEATIVPPIREALQIDLMRVRKSAQRNLKDDHHTGVNIGDVWDAL
ncbi:hypothetical protein [Haloferula sargassicola]|uniref:Uncharacterized protein n=1 Tax=Haloferula sargassicola TaxID=490096 RepID=A0ABP9UP68_9BACT